MDCQLNKEGFYLKKKKKKREKYNFTLCDLKINFRFFEEGSK